jgi:hypothetical protein
LDGCQLLLLLLLPQLLVLVLELLLLLWCMMRQLHCRCCLWSVTAAVLCSALPAWRRPRTS